ncbi:hypothetical protein HPP92_005779 [Vanilla planifolia]|uniref:Uncharacterized protein n=1 Tax=Vanilla planifolia TaxID=51239 RepID=A0A835VF74_VANPL|nr:hypothetical protein HPP92_005779 [Vanilla planifolia]
MVEVAMAFDGGEPSWPYGKDEGDEDSEVETEGKRVRGDLVGKAKTDSDAALRANMVVAAGKPTHGWGKGAILP